MSTKRKIRWFIHIVMSIPLVLTIPVVFIWDLILNFALVLMFQELQWYGLRTVNVWLGIIKNTNWINRD